MSSIAITDVSGEPAKGQVAEKAPSEANPKENDAGKKKGRIVQRNYILNNVAALKKKAKCETSRKQEFAFSKEAKNGSNVGIQMKTG